MKKVLFIALLFIGFNAFSQQGGMPSPEKIAESFVTKLTEDLSLSKDQATKLTGFAVGEIKSSMEKKQMPTLETVTASQERQKTFMKKILNAEQFKKYSEEIFPKIVESGKKRLEMMKNRQ